MLKKSFTAYAAIVFFVVTFFGAPTMAQSEKPSFALIINASEVSSFTDGDGAFTISANEGDSVTFTVKMQTVPGGDSRPWIFFEGFSSLTHLTGPDWRENATLLYNGEVASASMAVDFSSTGNIYLWTNKVGKKVSISFTEGDDGVILPTPTPTPPLPTSTQVPGQPTWTPVPTTPTPTATPTGTAGTAFISAASATVAGRVVYPATPITVEIGYDAQIPSALVKFSQVGGTGVHLYLMNTENPATPSKGWGNWKAALTGSSGMFAPIQLTEGENIISLPQVPWNGELKRIVVTVIRTGFVPADITGIPNSRAELVPFTVRLENEARKYTESPKYGDEVYHRLDLDFSVQEQLLTILRGSTLTPAELFLEFSGYTGALDVSLLWLRNDGTPVILGTVTKAADATSAVMKVFKSEPDMIGTLYDGGTLSVAIKEGNFPLNTLFRIGVREFRGSLDDGFYTPIQSKPEGGTLWSRQFRLPRALTLATPTPTVTPTAVPPTPTMTPAPLLVLKPGQLVVLDNIGSNVDLSGGVDLDAAGAEELVLRWKLPELPADFLISSPSVHIYVNGSYLGQVSSLLSTAFRWKKGTAKLAPWAQNGPVAGNDYLFKVIVFNWGYAGDPRHYELETKGAVLFGIDPNAPTPTPTPAPPTPVPPTPTVTPVPEYDLERTDGYAPLAAAKVEYFAVNGVSVEGALLYAAGREDGSKIVGESAVLAISTSPDLRGKEVEVGIGHRTFGNTSNVSTSLATQTITIPTSGKFPVVLGFPETADLYYTVGLGIAGNVSGATVRVESFTVYKGIQDLSGPPGSQLVLVGGNIPTPTPTPPEATATSTPTPDLTATPTATPVNLGMVFEVVGPAEDGQAVPVVTVDDQYGNPAQRGVLSVIQISGAQEVLLNGVNLSLSGTGTSRVAELSLYRRLKTQATQPERWEFLGASRDFSTIMIPGFVAFKPEIQELLVLAEIIGDPAGDLSNTIRATLTGLRMRHNGSDVVVPVLSGVGPLLVFNQSIPGPTPTPTPTATATPTPTTTPTVTPTPTPIPVWKRVDNLADNQVAGVSSWNGVPAHDLLSAAKAAGSLISGVTVEVEVSEGVNTSTGSPLRYLLLERGENHTEVGRLTIPNPSWGWPWVNSLNHAEGRNEDFYFSFDGLTLVLPAGEQLHVRLVTESLDPNALNGEWVRSTITGMDGDPGFVPPLTGAKLFFTTVSATPTPTPAP